MTTSEQSRLGDAPEEGIKAPVVAISTGQEALFGIGQSIAGVVIGDQDRVAIAAQTDTTENGIYVARGGKDWERATDFNNSDDVINGQLLVTANTSAVYSIIAPTPWNPGQNSVSFGLLLSPVGFFWGAITGTLSDQADLQAELDAKAEVVHTHVEADIVDLQAYILDAPADSQLYGRFDNAWVVVDFSVFAAAVHTHVEADIVDLQPYLLDAAGSIANDNQLFARANNGWQAFSTSSGTTGEIIAWPDTDPPQNFLVCDGTAQNAVTFADLFAVLGYKFGGSGANFNLPDLRGQFIRGTAAGSGNDPDRTSRTDRGDGTTGDIVGTKQGDQFKSHGHTVAVRVDPDSDTEGGGGDPRPDFGPLATSLTGGSETRPTNVGMTYIIRYTGGGSGITQPPSIEVQDNGVPLTTAVQLLNFLGFNLEVPLTDQVTIQYGASPNAASYCPGYPFVYISDISWRIESFDVTNLYSVGRRIRFIDGAANYYGTITGSVFSSGNTTMAMNMEGGEILTVNVTDHCIVDGGTGWVPISQDPFNGSAINDIQAGDVNGTIYWVACGDLGKAAWSKDGGLNWTVIPPASTSHLNCVNYSPLHQTFIMAGDSAAFIRSTPGDPEAAWDDRTSVMAALSTGGVDQIRGVYFEDETERWGVLWNKNVSVIIWDINYDDQDNAETMAGIGMSDGGLPGSWHQMERRNVAPSGEAICWGLGDDVVQVSDITSPSESSVDDFTSQVIGHVFPLVNGIARGWAGQIGGQIETYPNQGVDTVTFGSSAVNGIDWSPVHERAVAVGDDGKIGWMEGGDIGQPNAWQLAQNGSNPLANFRQVRWNTQDGLFIAVNDQGQILRSATGVTPPGPVPTETGFTLIAADPFSGSNISHIKSGTISGQVYWVTCGGSLMFISTDAGVTWNQITHGASGTVVSLAYSASLEAFVAGFSGGDLSYTFTGGTTWTADTTTVAALAFTGSNSINGLYYFEDTGTWLILFPDSGSLTTSYTAPDITAAVWSQLDIGLNNPVDETELEGSKDGGDNRLFFMDNSTRVNYFADGNDTSSQSYLAVAQNPPPRTAFKVEAGTVVAAPDMHLGNNAGEVTFVTNNIEYSQTRFPGAVRGFALSTVSGRYVAVGDAGKIFTEAIGDVENGIWIEVINPFTANINAVWYDPSDDMIIAVGSNGEIGRSVDGIS